ncbi:MAG: GTPase HflX [Nitrospinota bacterium]
MNRKGRVTHVILGDDRQIEIPRIVSRKIAGKRLSGLRCIHTHVKREPITQDDLNDLVLLRLDLIVTVDILQDGAPAKLTMAHISPDTEKPHTIIGPAPFAEIEKNFDGLITMVEAELEKTFSALAVDSDQIALLIHVSDLPQNIMESSINELAQLARTAGIYAADTVTQRRKTPNPRYLMGKGKLRDFMVKALSMGINTVIFDTELTAGQLKAIADFTDIDVMDRTQLILTIFERHAKSRDGKVRVELARMKYLLPRLGAKESALSRIRGGIGLRGPGETTAETQRRHLQRRISTFEKELEQLKSKREEKRKRRIRGAAKAISIIGYTNAGKSTLLNKLTGSKTMVKDILFSTLDPSTRKLWLGETKTAVISDTVGLIRDMPDSLLGVFRATLEELKESDLLIHLVDASDPGFEEHIETAEKIMRDLGLLLDLDSAPVVTVFNKIELIDSETAKNICKRFGATGISASTGQGIKELLERVKGALFDATVTAH